MAFSINSKTNDITLVRGDYFATVVGMKKNGEEYIPSEGTLRFAMPNRGAVTGTISSKSSYTIPQGYHDGSGKVSIDSTSASLLVPENIRENITILGIKGEMSGSENMKAQAVTATPTFASQTITPDSSQDYNCISQVTVNAIPVTYSDNAAGGQTVTIG